jgi:hypothetical protein
MLAFPTIWSIHLVLIEICSSSCAYIVYEVDILVLLPLLGFFYLGLLSSLGLFITPKFRNTSIGIPSNCTQGIISALISSKSMIVSNLSFSFLTLF